MPAVGCGRRDTAELLRHWRNQWLAQRGRRNDTRTDMHVALLTTFAVTKKEPLAVLLERIHAAFAASGLGEPSVLFTFSDAPVPGAFSTVDRLLKKSPEFTRFTGERSIVP